MVTFGTAGIRGDVTEQVTPLSALEIGRAMADMATEVVLGRDGRTTSRGLADAAAAGLASGGATVIDVGVVPTAALAASSRGRTGLMITASHNPPSDNGLKLFRDGEEFDGTLEGQIEAAVDASDPPREWQTWGTRLGRNVLESYRTEVTEYLAGIGAPAGELTVAIDCGHGMAGLATPEVVARAGAEIRVVNGTPDGHFPARPSKPTPETLADFGTFVGESDADLGIAHDGDADRIVILDHDGAVVHEDTILAILGHYYVTAAEVADPVVVTTPNASQRVDTRVREAGGRVVRTPLGALHEGIADVDTDGETAVVFAGEPWKHIHPAFGGWIDGIVSAGLLVRLVAAAKGVNALREPIQERPYLKRSVPCPDPHKDGALEHVERLLSESFSRGDIDTSYGVRLTWPDDAWTLVRASGTEPKLRIYLEATDVEERMVDVRQVVETAIEAAQD